MIPLPEGRGEVPVFDVHVHGFEPDAETALPALVRERERFKTPCELIWVELNRCPVWKSGEVIGYVSGKLPALHFKDSGGERYALVVKDGAIYVLSNGFWTRLRHLPLAMIRRELRRQRAYPFNKEKGR